MIDRRQLKDAAEVAEQQADRAEQDTESPTPPATGDADGKTAEKDQEQETVEKAARGTDQFSEATLHIGKDGETERAEKEIDADGAETEFPTESEAAESDGKGLKRHGNAQKVNGDGNDGKNRNDGGEKSGKRNFKGAGVFRGVFHNFTKREILSRVGHNLILPYKKRIVNSGCIYNGKKAASAAFFPLYLQKGLIQCIPKVQI